MRALIVGVFLALGASSALADFCDASVSRIKRETGRSTAVVTLAQGAWVETRATVGPNAGAVTSTYVRSKILRTVEISCACAHEEQPCRCLLSRINAEVDAAAAKEGLTPIHD